MKKLLIASYIIAGVFGVNAQNSIILKSTTPQVSPTIAGGTSVLIGDGAGNSVQNSAANNVFVGFISGISNNTGSDNTFLGWGSGSNNTSGVYNTFIGRSAGSGNSTGSFNTYIGALTSEYCIGSDNVFLGFSSGRNSTTGSGNTFLGNSAGYDNLTGINNTIVGNGAGHSNGSGWNNTIVGFGAGGLIANQASNSILGWFAGREAVGGGNVLLGEMAGFKAGSNNVLIGNHAGELAVGIDHQLYIDNSSTSTPLIWGDFWNDQLKLNGKVGIGNVITFPTNPLYAHYKLFVSGGILTDEVRVRLSANGTWADYVFEKDYALKPLSEVESFIAENGHLPNVPSAAKIKENGIDVADMARIQQEKIEELTLYIIEQNKRIEALEAKIK